jgi:hypothetical protein
VACSLYAHGHLNLLRHRRHLGLRRVRTALAPDRMARIALSLSPANLVAVRRALGAHYTVKASIEVQAAGVDGQDRAYRVSVTLSYR